MDSQELNNVDCYFVDSASRIDVFCAKSFIRIAMQNNLSKKVSRWSKQF